MSKADQLVVGPCQVRFPHLEETESYMNVDSGKYSCTFLFDPDSDSVPAMKKAIAAANGGKGTNPLSQIAEDAEWDKGQFKIKGKTKYRPKIINALGEAVTPDRVAGATVQAVLAFAPYTVGTGGVTVYLQAIRILQEGSGGDIDFGPIPEGYTPGADEELNDSLPF